jgi:hypothetical protein
MPASPIFAGPESAWPTSTSLCPQNNEIHTAGGHMPPKKPLKAAPAADDHAKPAPVPAPPVAAAPAAAAPPAVGPIEIPATPPSLANPDTIVTYKALYDMLGRAYWEASDINAKDTIQGVRDAIYDILTDLNIAQLKANTALYLAVMPKIRHTNAALGKIKDDISSITKNINTAATVMASITKVLAIIGKI